MLAALVLALALPREPPASSASTLVAAARPVATFGDIYWAPNVSQLEADAARILRERDALCKAVAMVRSSKLNVTLEHDNNLVAHMETPSLL